MKKYEYVINSVFLAVHHLSREYNMCINNAPSVSVCQVPLK